MYVQKATLTRQKANSAGSIAAVNMKIRLIHVVIASGVPKSSRDCFLLASFVPH